MAPSSGSPAKARSCAPTAVLVPATAVVLVFLWRKAWQAAARDQLAAVATLGLISCKDI